MTQGLYIYYNFAWVPHTFEGSDPPLISHTGRRGHKVLGDDAAEAATMLVRHSRNVYGNGENWDPAADLGMACSARV